MITIYVSHFNISAKYIHAVTNWILIPNIAIYILIDYLVFESAVT